MVDTAFEKIIIGVESDGWTIKMGDKTYSWNHNDPDMGTDQIKSLLTDLGEHVVMEEWY